MTSRSWKMGSSWWKRSAMQLEASVDSVAESDVALLKRAYEAFNARDIGVALATMQPDVEWPNGMEGGTVHGHAGVREYWTRQWGVLDPHVEPVSFAADEQGRIVVDVHQVVHDISRKLLLDRIVQHV